VDHGGGIDEKRTRRYMGGGESAIVLDRRMGARSRGGGGGLLIAGCDVDESADRSPIGGLVVGSLLLSDSPIGGYIGCYSALRGVIKYGEKGLRSTE
jgi:hypothetical protein